MKYETYEKTKIQRATIKFSTSILVLDDDKKIQKRAADQKN